MAHACTLAAALAVAGAACSSATSRPETASPDADHEWVRSVCDQPMPDTAGWPRYQLGNVSIAVPPQYRRTRPQGLFLQFTRGANTSMVVSLDRASTSTFFYNLPGQVGCDTDYGGYAASALSWSGRGQYFAVARWLRLNEPDERGVVQATIRTTRLRDAVALRAALQTIRRAADEPGAPTGNPDAWFHAPCMGDSVDSFSWTRYDLRAVRIRVPGGTRRVPMPDLNELHFRKGRATMRLRLHNDASQLFAEYYTPQKTYKYCQGEMSGLLVEAISFREYANYGFAARWSDADRGEWLAAVIRAPTLAEVTALRRALFTLTFAGSTGR